MSSQRMLNLYKDDIAERHVCSRQLLEMVLANDCDEDNLLASYGSKTNSVRMMYKLIEHSLKTNERANTFLTVARQLNGYLFKDLEETGPRGKFGEKKPFSSEHKACYHNNLPHIKVIVCLFQRGSTLPQ